ncbi:porin family protein [Bradyrhizobium diazoefficiens]|nr:porin family protein [Bradyrhizobium diazoefficiens]
MSRWNVTSGCSSNCIFISKRPTISRTASILSRAGNWSVDNLKKLFGNGLIKIRLSCVTLTHAAFRQQDNLSFTISAESCCFSAWSKTSPARLARRLASSMLQNRKLGPLLASAHLTTSHNNTHGDAMRETIAILLGATALSLAGPAFAADMPAKAPVYAPSYNWTGFYFGANAGYGFGHAPTSVVPNATEAGFLADPLCVSSNCAPAPAASHLNGFVGGGQMGYNFQSGNIVAGLETDLSFAGLRKSDTATGNFYIGGILATTVDTKLDWFGTLRGRLGFLPTNSLLLYGTGGVAYGAVKTTVTTLNVAGCGFLSIYCSTGSADGTSVGWTIGAGAEYAVAPAWTVKAEYLHIDLGSRSFTATDPNVPGGAITSTTSFKMDTVRIGMNYKLGAL